jgi:hypothetical protein
MRQVQSALLTPRQEGLRPTEMTPHEVANLAKCAPDSKPPGFGRTFIARSPEGGDARALLVRIRRAWEVIARWGRWSDEELGEWPPTEECLRQLPAWLHGALKHEPSFEVENWMDDLHDRDWVWWSGTAFDHLVKIDLCSGALPISTWPIGFVIERAGAAVVYRGDWLPSNEVVGRTGEWV